MRQFNWMLVQKMLFLNHIAFLCQYKPLKEHGFFN